MHLRLTLSLSGILIFLFSACGPSLEGDSAEERMDAIRACDETESGDKLVEMALGDFSREVAAAAVARLTDEERLMKVAIGENEFEKRMYSFSSDKSLVYPIEDELGKAAVDKIMNERLLFKVATEALNPNVRIAATEKLNYEANLLQLADTSDDKLVRAAAVAGISSLEALTRLALKQDETWYVCHAALIRLEDPEALIEVATKGAHWRLRTEAAQKLSDEVHQLQIVLSPTDCDIRTRALARISDQTLLVKAAAQADDWRVRQAAAERLTLSESLADVAVNDPDYSVRSAATRRLTDQALLKRIATTDPDFEVRMAAVSRIIDPSVLRAVSQEEVHPRVCFAIAAILDDQKIFADLAIREKIYPISKEAFERVTDDAQLIRIAKDASYDMNRRDAVKLIDDQAVLVELTRAETDPEVLQEIMKKLDDQVMLAQFAVKNWYRWWASAEAARKLTDQEKLKEIVFGEYHKVIRTAAAEAITDQETLIRILNDEPEYEVRVAAVNNLTDQDVLYGAAKNDSEVWVRKYAAARLTNDDRLLDIIATEASCHVNEAAVAAIQDKSLLPRIVEGEIPGPKIDAVKNITDQAFLEDLVLNHDNDSIRAAAVKNISSQELLGRVLAEDISYDVRGQALEKITDPQWLACAVDDPEYYIRRDLAKKLEDPKLLEKMATEDPHYDVRRNAIERLTGDDALERIALSEESPELAFLAADKIFDPGRRSAAIEKSQSACKEGAADGENAAIRKRNMRNVKDHDFLLARSRRDSSRSVRLAALWAMEDLTFLAHVGIESEYAVMRNTARYRLRDDPTGILDRLKAAEKKLEEAVASMEKTTDPVALAEAALHADFDVLRSTAAERLCTRTELIDVASLTTDQAIRRIVLEKIEDEADLEAVAASTRDRATRLAVDLKLGRTTWEELVAKAAEEGASLSELGDVVGAMALFPRDAVAPEIVVRTCHKYIRAGDESRIPELWDLLMMHGDELLAEDYLNCGQPDLADAGGAWAKAHGMSVNSGHGSNRVSWGSGN